jgi:hypothetical protein
MRYILILLLILSTNIYAQFGGGGMGGGRRHNKTSSNNNNDQSSQGTFEDGWSKRQHEMEVFDNNVLPLLKAKKVQDEKINVLRRLPSYELGPKLKELGIDPDSIEVKDSSGVKKDKKTS